jgi:hypothetical protein
VTAGAFARSLPDFAREAGRPAPSFERTIREPAPPADDPAKLLADAHDRGFRDGAAAARAEFEQLRADDAAAHELRLVEERQRWSEQESDRLATEIAAGLQRIEAELATGVARALAPFVAEQVRRTAVDELSQTLTALLADGGARTMVVHGPRDLVERLRPKLAPYAASVQFETTAAADILVTTGETIVETQITAWLDRLAAAVE